MTLHASYVEPDTGDVAAHVAQQTAWAAEANGKPQPKKLRLLNTD